MKLTILGCGTVSWQRGRACSCYHVAAGDAAVILDCGSGAMKRFEDAGLDYFALDAALLSHSEHPDHAADLGMLLFSLNYTTRGTELRVRHTPVLLGGPPGTAEFVRLVHAAHPPTVPQHFTLDVRECGDDTLSIHDVTLTARRVSHGDTPALGWRLEHDGRVLAYSGDSGPCEALIDLLRDADLGIVECSVPAGIVELPNHLNARQVGVSARRAGLRRLLVTHQYPGADDAVIADQIGEAYGGPLHFARDLDTYEV